MRLRPALLLSALSAAFMVGSVSAGDPDRGRALWQNGETGDTRLEARLEGPGLKLAPPVAACARCHGMDAEGGEEGGVVVPPLAGRGLLIAGIRSAVELEAVLERGRSRRGADLHPAMPRYENGPEIAGDLHAFLSGLHNAAPPGVRRDELILGAILPNQGRLASQAARLRTLYERAVQDLEARGGLYGRRVRLALLPTAASAGASALAAALDAAPVVAVVSALGIEPMGPEEVLLAERGIPCLFALRPPGGPSGHCRFELRADDRRVVESMLERALEDMAPGGRIALLPGAAARLGPLDELDAHHAEIDFVDPVDRSEQPPLDAVILGPEASDVAHVESLATRSRLGPTPVFAHIDQLGRLAAAGLAGRVVLTDPHPPGSSEFPPASRLRAWLGTPPDAEIPALERLAYAAIVVAEEALRASGRRLTRARLIAEIEALSGLETGLLPPLDYVRYPAHGLGSVRFIVLDEEGQLARIEDWP